jgi:DNA-binding response OmpR family regulator
LTGSSDSDELRSAMKQGADAYLIKPFQVNELLAVINRFV